MQYGHPRGRLTSDSVSSTSPSKYPRPDLVLIHTKTNPRPKHGHQSPSVAYSKPSPPKHGHQQWPTDFPHVPTGSPAGSHRPHNKEIPMVRFPVCSGTSIKTIIRAGNVFLILVDFLAHPALPPVLKLQIFDSVEMSPY